MPSCMPLKQQVKSIAVAAFHVLWHTYLDQASFFYCSLVLVPFHFSQYCGTCFFAELIGRVQDVSVTCVIQHAICFVQAGTPAELLSGVRETDLPQLLTANGTSTALGENGSLLHTKLSAEYSCKVLCAPMESGLAATGQWDHRL